MRVFGRSRVPSTQGTDAARLLITGDLDGALIAAERAKAAHNSLTRSEGYAVLAWVHLMRGDHDEAEAAASVARRMRTRDPLLPVAELWKLTPEMVEAKFPAGEFKSNPFFQVDGAALHTRLE